MKLPEAFKDKMLKLLGDSEYEEFVAALNGQRQYGMRVNTLKAELEEFIGMSPFRLEAVPWTDDGFYISGEDAPGRHPYYHAGLYYIQEPSAMLPGKVLGAEPGDRVLDICAAPGGKSVQIAAALKGSGLLVSNDINTERVKALVKNIELCGIRNAIVLNESPERLAQSFEGYFDKILIDAPCSGEGMFRKDETAARSWESFKCERCTQLQEPILRCAHRMLKPSGILVYSTCTFSPEENERMIAGFIREHPGYELVEIPKIAGIEGGRPQWAVPDTAFGQAPGQTLGQASCPASEDSYDNSNSNEYGKCDGYYDLERTARLWPHRVRGEGHFVAKLMKCGNGSPADADPVGNKLAEKAEGEITVPYDKLPASFDEFVRNNMTYFPTGVFMIKGHNLYHLPEQPPLLAGLKTAKFGWFLGSFEGNRFEPSHSLVTALDKKAFRRTVDFKADSREISSYLKGETLMIEGEKGLTAVCVDGKTLGWAKQTGDMLKNMYPKGWRRLS
jgi:NOL1/NOP2/sun family putative RNA methylase